MTRLDEARAKAADSMHLDGAKEVVAYLRACEADYMEQLVTAEGNSVLLFQGAVACIRTALADLERPIRKAREARTSG